MAVAKLRHHYLDMDIRQFADNRWDNQDLHPEWDTSRWWLVAGELDYCDNKPPNQLSENSLKIKWLTLKSIRKFNFVETYANWVSDFDDVTCGEVCRRNRWHFHVNTNYFLLADVAPACILLNYHNRFMSLTCTVRIGMVFDLLLWNAMFPRLDMIRNSSIRCIYLNQLHREFRHWLIAVIFNLNFQIDDLAGCVATDWRPRRDA